MTKGARACAARSRGSRPSRRPREDPSPTNQTTIGNPWPFGTRLAKTGSNGSTKNAWYFTTPAVSRHCHFLMAKLAVIMMMMMVMMMSRRHLELTARQAPSSALQDLASLEKRASKLAQLLHQPSSHTSYESPSHLMAIRGRGRHQI